jgi:outer membrane protein assembly factor BamB
LWTIKKGSNVSSPIYHNGHLYWVNDNIGIAYCVDTKTGHILYEKRLERADQVYSAAVLADGKLYYMTRTGRVFVIAAKPEFEQLAMNQLGIRGKFDSSPALADGKLYLRSDRLLYCLGGK